MTFQIRKAYRKARFKKAFARKSRGWNYDSCMNPRKVIHWKDWYKRAPKTKIQKH